MMVRGRFRVIDYDADAVLCRPQCNMGSAGQEGGYGLSGLIRSYAGGRNVASQGSNKDIR